MKIGVIGLGIVGETILHVMKFFHDEVKGYDKYKPSDLFVDICDTDIIFVAVPTNDKNGRLDCSMVIDVLEKLEANPYSGVICIKSTVGVGFLDKARKFNLRIVYMPEFLHERTRLADFVSANYFVMSGKKEDLNRVKEALFWVDDDKFFIVDDRTAEIVKLAMNAFAATKISFVNEIKKICDKVGADAKIVMEILRKDKRCGGEYTDPARGPYRGKCLPKDTRELMNCTKVSVLLKAVEEVNERTKREM